MKSLRFAGESVGNIERTSHAKRELRVFIETKIVKEIKAILTTYKKEKKTTNIQSYGFNREV